MADKRRPDVVVMDVRMDGMDGFEATRQIIAAHPEIAVILYTAHGERGLLAEGLDCGARGYVLKDAPPDDIVRAVKRVAEGGAYVDPTLASSWSPRRRPSGSRPSPAASARSWASWRTDTRTPRSRSGCSSAPRRCARTSATR